MHTDSLPIEYLLDPSLNLPKSLNPNHVLNTLILPGYLLISDHLCHIEPLFIPQYSTSQKGVTIWITSPMNSSSSYKQQLMPTRNRMMRNK